MKMLTNFPLYDGCLDAFPGGMAEVAESCRELGLDGLEVIWDHQPYTQEMPPAGLAIGYHMLFFSHWVDYWQGNEPALMAEYGSWDMVREYYRGTTRAEMVKRYRDDLQHAVEVGAEYLVFHVSDVSLEECFTYRFAHSDNEVIDCSAELVNEIFDGVEGDFALLLENQWWPGLTFTEPEKTRRLLDAVAWENKGIMLDTGHLMSTNTKLRTQAEAARYIADMFDAHGELGAYVRGLHLHQSLSGEYVEGEGFRVPDDYRAIEAYWDRYARVYQHILHVDRHQPWTDPAVGELVRHLGPEWVNNELSGYPREKHEEAVRTQMAALRAR